MTRPFPAPSLRDWPVAEAIAWSLWLSGWIGFAVAAGSGRAGSQGLMLLHGTAWGILWARTLAAMAGLRLVRAAAAWSWRNGRELFLLGVKS